MHWLNLIPEAPFYTVGDGTLRALTDLLRLFTTAINPAISPVPATTAPTLLVVPSPRVPASLSLAPVIMSPSLYPRVFPVSTPPLPHLIAPDDDDPVTCCRYLLRSRPWISLSEHGLHLISAAAKFSTAAEFPPTALTIPLFAYATRFLLTVDQHRHREINAVID